MLGRNRGLILFVGLFLPDSLHDASSKGIFLTLCVDSSAGAFCDEVVFAPFGEVR